MKPVPQHPCKPLTRGFVTKRVSEGDFDTAFGLQPDPTRKIRHSVASRRRQAVGGRSCQLLSSPATVPPSHPAVPRPPASRRSAFGPSPMSTGPWPPEPTATLPQRAGAVRHLLRPPHSAGPEHASRSRHATARPASRSRGGGGQSAACNREREKRHIEDAVWRLWPSVTPAQSRMISPFTSPVTRRFGVRCLPRLPGPVASRNPLDRGWFTSMGDVGHARSRCRSRRAVWWRPAPPGRVSARREAV